MSELEITVKYECNGKTFPTATEARKYRNYKNRDYGYREKEAYKVTTVKTCVTKTERLKR